MNKKILAILIFLNFNTYRMTYSMDHKLVQEASALKNINNNKLDNLNQALILAAKNQNINKVKDLLASGADVNARNTNEEWLPLNYTPLHAAASTGNEEITKLLINHGAYVNIRDNSSFTPLYKAISSHNFNVSKLLLASGADIDIKTKGGWTALHSAVSAADRHIIRILIDKTTDINAKNNTGNTPLHLASMLGLKDVVELLLKNGADKSIKNKEKKTAATIAKYKGLKDFINRDASMSIQKR